MALTSSTARKNATLDLNFDLLNSGKIRIYDGSRPAGPDTAITSQVLLAELTFGATAFAAASSGSKTANAITAATIAADGTATWGRLVTSGGTALYDFSVSTSGADANFNAVAFVTGAEASISSFVVSHA